MPPCTILWPAVFSRSGYHWLERYAARRRWRGATLARVLVPESPAGDDHRAEGVAQPRKKAVAFRREVPRVLVKGGIQAESQGVADGRVACGRCQALPVAGRASGPFVRNSMACTTPAYAAVSRRPLGPTTLRTWNRSLPAVLSGASWAGDCAAPAARRGERQRKRGSCMISGSA